MSAATESTLTPGERLDRYQLVLPLASGGMAEVWLARLRGKRGFEKLFAVKTVLAELSKNPRVQRTFVTEARIASAIHHPNVAEILDVGEHRGHLFLVLEYVEGGSLSQLRRSLAEQGRAFPMSVALRVASDISRGLHAAHTLRGDSGKAAPVVHRDVSPQNVLVGRAGAVKLIDFGIAKAIHTAAEETGVGHIAGKVWYMAPEQALSGAVDARTDVWGVGAVLHHLLAGYPPYRSASEGEALAALCSGESPARVEGLPDSVTEILARTLAYEPRDRFTSAEELHLALERCIASTVGVASASELAQLVEEVLEDELRERRTRIGSALSTLEVSAPDPAPVLPRAPAPTLAAPAAARAADASTPTRTRARRGSFIWAGVALGSALFALGLLFSVVNSRPAEPSPPKPELATAVESPAVRIVTATVPPEANDPVEAEPPEEAPAVEVATEPNPKAPRATRPTPPKKPSGPKSVIDVFGEARK